MKLPELSDRELKLIPSEDKEYIVYLANRNKYHLSEVIGTSLDYIKHIWLGEVEGERAGVIYLCYLPNVCWWTLDAYKEDEALRKINPRGDFSYRAGKLVLKWFYENIGKTIYTGHETLNRGATLVCKRLGFEEIGHLNEFVIMKAGE